MSICRMCNLILDSYAWLPFNFVILMAPLSYLDEYTQEKEIISQKTEQ